MFVFICNNNNTVIHWGGCGFGCPLDHKHRITRADCAVQKVVCACYRTSVYIFVGRVCTAIRDARKENFKKCVVKYL